jgi:ParB family chromosome partitioning protein
VPLGKSLNNIIDDYFNQEQESQLNDESSNIQSEVREIEISSIKISEYQTRTNFDEEKIQKLSENIKTQGLIQPVVVLQKKITNSTKPEYTLLAGERRLRAVKRLNQTTILAVIRREETLTEPQQAMLSAMENLQREDLSPIEMAQTFKMLTLTQGINELELAEMLGNSEQYVKNYLRLLTLHKNVQKALSERLLSEGQARSLTSLEEDLQLKVLNKILEQNLTVKEIQALVKNLKEKASKTITKKPTLKSFTHPQAMEIMNKVEKITEYFGKKAKMKCTGDDKQGKIVISWKE